MGVATTQQVGPNFTALMSAADKALYAVKQSGRGQYKFYDGAETSLEEAGESVYANQSEILDYEAGEQESPEED